MASTTDVANMALTLLGERPITSLDDRGAPAVFCKNNLSIAVDEMLRACPWRSFIQRKELSALGTTPAFGYEYEYQLPSETMRVLEVQVNEIQLSSYDEWTIEDSKILSHSEGPLQIRYMKHDLDVNNWDKLFFSAVAHRLAVLVAEPITNSASKRQQCDAMYQEVLKQAKRANAREQSSMSLNDPGVLDRARLGDLYAMRY